MDRGTLPLMLDDGQRMVFAHVLNGKTGREIAAELCMSPAQIDGIVRKTCRQLNTSTRHDAARLIADHYGWKAGSGVSNDRWKARTHHAPGARRFHEPAKMAQTDREQTSKAKYVRDAGCPPINSDDDTGKHIGVTKYFNLAVLAADSTITHRLLLMMLLIACFSLALSALISAMQGFQVLMFS